MVDRLGDYRALPEGVWLCPVDHPDFYVRDEDTREPHICPQDGCQEKMVRYARDSRGAVEALEAIRDGRWNRGARRTDLPVREFARLALSSLNQLGGQ